MPEWFIDILWQTNDGAVYINNMYTTTATTPFTVTGMGTIKDVKCVNGHISLKMCLENSLNTLI